MTLSPLSHYALFPHPPLATLTTLLPLISATRHPAITRALSPRDGPVDRNIPRLSLFRKEPTRNHNTCQCLPWFVPLGNVWEICCCGDEKNTELAFEGHADEGVNEHAVCKCLGNHQRE